LYKAKYTLSQLVKSGVMNELFGTITRERKVAKSDEINVEELNAFNIMSILANLCITALLSYDSNVKAVVRGNSHIQVNVNYDIETSYNAVLSNLQANKTLIQSYANHSQELASALNSQLKFDSKNKDKGKLYLRINNLEEVKSMTPRQKKALLDNIVENIYFNRDFAKAQASLGLRGKNNRDMFFTSLSSGQRKGYSTLCKEWERKVGYNGI